MTPYFVLWIKTIKNFKVDQLNKLNGIQAEQTTVVHGREASLGHNQEDIKEANKLSRIHSGFQTSL